LHYQPSSHLLSTHKHPDCTVHSCTTNPPRICSAHTSILTALCTLALPTLLASAQHTLLLIRRYAPTIPFTTVHPTPDLHTCTLTTLLKTLMLETCTLKKEEQLCRQQKSTHHIDEGKGATYYRVPQIPPHYPHVPSYHI